MEVFDRKRIRISKEELAEKIGLKGYEIVAIWTEKDYDEFTNPEDIGKITAIAEKIKPDKIKGAEDES